MTTDREYMSRAIEIARKSMKDQGGPFGAIIVLKEEVVGEGSNRVTDNHDPTAHAEILAIRSACTKLKTYDLTGSTIYTSCEPCPMCLGAILWARIDRVVYAATRDDASKIAGFDDDNFYEEIGNSWGKRRIQSSQISSELGRKVFEEWISKPDKKMY